MINAAFESGDLIGANNVALAAAERRDIVNWVVKTYWIEAELSDDQMAVLKRSVGASLYRHYYKKVIKEGPEVGEEAGGEVEGGPPPAKRAKRRRPSFLWQPRPEKKKNGSVTSGDGVPKAVPTPASEAKEKEEEEGEGTCEMQEAT